MKLQWHWDFLQAIIFGMSIKGIKRPIKFFDPSTGLVWAGNGIRPKWVRDELAIRPEDSETVRAEAAALRERLGTPPTLSEQITRKVVGIKNDPSWQPSEKVLRFITNYGTDRNGARAAMRAGYSPTVAPKVACDLLANPTVRKLVDAEIDRIAKLAEFDAVAVLREWAMLATADPAKIIKTRRVNCRHCWGTEHEYQWSSREYAAACDKAASTKPPQCPPSCVGGFGWRSNNPPNPECPECCGEGTVEVLPFDMDTLGPAERKLIAGVKQTTAGLEIKLRDQDAALERIAKHLGMFIERKELAGAGGAPLMPTSIIVTGPEE